MVGSFHTSCSNMLNKWDEMVAKDGGSTRTRELDVWPHLQAMTSDVIARASFGSSYEEGGKIFELQKEQADRILHANRSLYFPLLRFLPTKVNRRMKEISREIESMFFEIIRRRMEDDHDAQGKDDLLGLLLESNMKEMKEHGNKYGMSMNEVIEECKIFFFAGQDTSASLLVWTLILLSKHGDWQSRARDEVLCVFGTSGKPLYQDLTHLKIVSVSFCPIFFCI